MTEKRFKNVGKDILQYGEWYCSAGGEHCADVIATAMNELIKENEQLKNKLKFFNELNKPYGTIIEENERLKRENKNLEAFRYNVFKLMEEARIWREKELKIKKNS